MELLRQFFSLFRGDNFFFKDFPPPGPPLRAWDDFDLERAHRWLERWRSYIQGPPRRFDEDIKIRVQDLYVRIGMAAPKVTLHESPFQLLNALFDHELDSELYRIFGLDGEGPQRLFDGLVGSALGNSRSHHDMVKLFTECKYLPELSTLYTEEVETIDDEIIQPVSVLLSHVMDVETRALEQYCLSRELILPHTIFAHFWYKGDMGESNAATHFAAHQFQQSELFDQFRFSGFWTGIFLPGQALLSLGPVGRDENEVVFGDGSRVLCGRHNLPYYEVSSDLGTVR